MCPKKRHTHQWSIKSVSLSVFSYFFMFTFFCVPTSHVKHELFIFIKKIYICVTLRENISWSFLYFVLFTSTGLSSFWIGMELIWTLCLLLIFKLRCCSNCLPKSYAKYGRYFCLFWIVNRRWGERNIQ